MEYELLWRNKWLTADAETIDDMIKLLRDAADELQKMKDRGVMLDDDGGVEDDHAHLVTDDPAVAEEFGFDEVESDEDEDWEEWDEEDECADAEDEPHALMTPATE